MTFESHVDQWSSVLVLLVSTCIVVGSAYGFDVNGFALLLLWHSGVLLLRSLVRSLCEPRGTDPSSLRRLLALLLEQPLYPLLYGSWDNSKTLLEFFARWSTFVFGVNVGSATLERELRSLWRVLGGLRLFVS
jgi:hypothetical protein